MMKSLKIIMLSTTVALFLSPLNVNAQENDDIRDYSPSELINFSKRVNNLNVEADNEREYLTDTQVENIPVGKYLQVYDELNRENMLTENTTELNELVAEKLVEQSSPLLTKSYLPDSYENLTDKEKELVKRHPLEAIVYYQKSTQAMEVSNSIYSENQLYQGNGDAFRHAYWNAILVKAYGNQTSGNTEKKALHGVERANAWTTAHEQNSSGVDKEMDLHNNNVGRYHAYLNFNKSDKNLENDLVKMVNEGQMARIVDGELVTTNSTK